MPKRKRTRFRDDFKQFFTRGLAILMPSILTLALLWWAYGFLRDRVAEPINGAVRQVVIWSAPQIAGPEQLPDWFRVTDEQVVQRHSQRENQGLAPVSDTSVRKRIRTEAFKQWWHERWYLQAIGFIVAIILVYLAGVLVGNLIGRRTIARAEKFISSLPLVRQVYPSIKQVVEFLLGSEDRVLPSNRVVVVEYPRKGIWSVGLMTGETMRSIEGLVGEECVTIFIPSSPTPFTGYTITVPKTDVRELPISIDDALRFCVSGGVLVPPGEKIGRETPLQPASGTAGGSNPAHELPGSQKEGAT